MALVFNAAKKALTEEVAKHFKVTRDDVFNEAGVRKTVTMIGAPKANITDKGDVLAENVHGALNVENAFKAIDHMMTGLENAYADLVNVVTTIVYESVTLCIEYDSFEPINYATAKLSALTDSKLKRGARVIYTALGFEFAKNRVTRLNGVAGLCKRMKSLKDAHVNVATVQMRKPEKAEPVNTDARYVAKASKAISEMLQSESEHLSSARDKSDKLKDKLRHAKTDKEAKEIKTSIERAELNAKKLSSSTNAMDLCNHILNLLPEDGLDFVVMQVLKDKFEEIIKALPELQK